MRTRKPKSVDSALKIRAGLYRKEMSVRRGTQERALMDGHEYEGRSILCFFDLSFSGDVWLARDVRSCTLNSETTRGRKT